ncbi:MAG: hypothetical protein ABFC84_15995 [Veillonellales bacterium]
MSNLLKKPTQLQNYESIGTYERFNLSENPFPSEPTVNKESTDKRINGNIYEMQIREHEYEQILTNFIKQPQNNPNHIRLGYIIDSSYIGRGNGKSAFLLNLLHTINREYSLDLSDEQNKCFAIYVSPEPGGRTKTFIGFIDAIFDSILKSQIISVCLATLRLEAINKLHPELNFGHFSESELVQHLNDPAWFENNSISSSSVQSEILNDVHLQDLPSDFPIFSGRNTFYPTFMTQKDFENYFRELKKPKEKIDFIFTHLVKFFLAANFNGAYVLVDDFERIPDFQSSRQKKDFALELRSCLFDGYYTNAKLGFYNLILVLHAGVPRLISDAWASSGMENRAPINQLNYKHIISFEKLTKEHVALLLKKYLTEYRIDPNKSDGLSPFTEGAVHQIGELSEFNAAKILRMAYELLEKAAGIPTQKLIDENFILDNRGLWETGDEPEHNIDIAKTTDLLSKAMGQEKE